MDDEITWRALLGKIISDPQERQRIADAVAINPITLTRWSTNKSNPRQDNLRPLLDALPNYRVKLTELIAREFPHFFNRNSITDERVQKISSAFYSQALHTYTTSPYQLRTSIMSNLILQQMLQHLDPLQQGIAIIIAKCVPPVADRKVRSLRKTASKATPPWEATIEHYTVFLGAESQSGHTLVTRHPIIIQTQTEKLRMFPNHNLGGEASVAAYPILMSDRTAGSLYLATTQANYFTPDTLELLQNYADLMVLACTTSDFYDLNTIELAVMPPLEKQLAYISTFQARVTRQMLLASQRGEQLTRSEAELKSWQDLEEELIQVSMQ